MVLVMMEWRVQDAVLVKKDMWGYVMNEGLDPM